MSTLQKAVHIKWMLVIYDLIILIMSDALLLVFYQSVAVEWLLTRTDVRNHFLAAFLCIFLVRYLGGVYHQVWRYGGIQCYIKLIFTDFLALLLYLGVNYLSPIRTIAFARLLSVWSLNLLGALAIRMIYRYAYKCHDRETAKGRLLSILLRIFAGKRIENEKHNDSQKIKAAIVGAGRIGVNLAEELIYNDMAPYLPCCFIDVDREKAGKVIHGIPVLYESDGIAASLHKYEVQEVIFAISWMDADKTKSLYEYYKKLGYKIKVYDYPTMYAAGGKRSLREFEVEDLLFRKPRDFSNDRTTGFYAGKRVLITGGGGSIGSELCRQIARMHPAQLVILDIYENCAYDIQQELRMKYGNELDFQVEIVSVTNRKGLERVFAVYRPEIVIHAAAHKHVPLMEKNCVEAVENNVFGTLNVVQLCEEYHAKRFLMVSTDKAVNPTNVMGATKRVCEMIAQAYSTTGSVTYSATRFGNVLGSAGSVIPLFKKQIAAGGPVTITDRRIVRYFMTIPEAAQLVLESGAMAHNGELFVLDMGEPVKILDLAEQMIRLSGIRGVEIVETGLRPGEKLYEELLIHTEELDRTENSMIFIERDRPVPAEELEKKLAVLRSACEAADDDAVREALKAVVPTYKSPEEVNRAGIAAAEYAVETTEDGRKKERQPLAGRPEVVT